MDHAPRSASSAAPSTSALGIPLKSYLKTLTADDMIATKAGVIVAKIKTPGSMVDNVMATAFGQKRNVVKEAEVGNVINVGVDEAIE